MTVLHSSYLSILIIHRGQTLSTRIIALWKTKYGMQMLIELLQRKNDIDYKNLNALNYVSYDRWIIDAIEALLKIELERQKKSDI
jgi:hypothetical protein